MGKSIQILCVLAICLSLILSSCASAPRSDSHFSGTSRSAEASGENRMMTFSVMLELVVKNTEETRNLLVRQVGSNNGYITRTTQNSVTAQIPSENMDDFLNYARTLGNVDNERKTGIDVTDQYRNDAIRLNSLITIRDRYLALLERATNISDLISIEREVERLTLEIEGLEGRIQDTELRVAYSDITVRFRERVRPGPVGWIFYGLYRGVRWLFVWN